MVELLCRVELAQFYKEEKFCANKAEMSSIIIVTACHGIFYYFVFLKSYKISKDIYDSVPFS